MGASERARRRSRLGAAASALALVVCGSCSLTTADYTECTNDDPCRAAFGFGAACREDGFCERVPQHVRCEQTYPEDLFTRPERHRDTIVFGSIVDRSLDTHRARERAARLAAAHANEAGGLDRRPLGIVFCTIEENATFDALGRDDAAVATARWLAEDIGVPAIVGAPGSSETLAVYQAVRESGVAVISPSATSPALTEIEALAPSDEMPGFLWRTAPPDSLQGAAIASDMKARGSTSVAVIHETGSYGAELARVFVQSFDDGTHTSLLFPFSGAASRDETVAAVGEMMLDEVLFVSSQTTDAIAFLNAADVLTGYATKRLFLTDAAANADLLAGARGAVMLFDQVRGTRPAVPTGFVYDAFVASYSATYSSDARAYSYTAHAYDATWLAIYGATWSYFREGRITGLGIARGLREVSSGRAVEMRASTFPVVVESFRAGTSIDVMGASGPLDYDPATEETTAAIEFWVISPAGEAIVSDGRFEP